MQLSASSCFPFPFYKQADAMDCGPTCLRMVAKYQGKNYSLTQPASQSLHYPRRCFYVEH
ncbi:MAG: C39 family peptidase [Chryseotalea sp. WA131a]|nr:MAG: C39 family peptidase [Chryseotalea sp. WA131a]